MRTSHCSNGTSLAYVHCRTIFAVWELVVRTLIKPSNSFKVIQMGILTYVLKLLLLRDRSVAAATCNYLGDVIQHTHVLHARTAYAFT